MTEFMPTDDEALTAWCRHQIDQLPAVGESLGMTLAEIASLCDDCRFLITALDERKRPARKTVATRRAEVKLVRIKRTSVRRQIEQAKSKRAYNEEKGRELRWVGPGFSTHSQARAGAGLSLVAR